MNHLQADRNLTNAPLLLQIEYRRNTGEAGPSKTMKRSVLTLQKMLLSRMKMKRKRINILAVILKKQEVGNLLRKRILNSNFRNTRNRSRRRKSKGSHLSKRVCRVIVGGRLRCDRPTPQPLNFNFFKKINFSLKHLVWLTRKSLPLIARIQMSRLIAASMRMRNT